MDDPGQVPAQSCLGSGAEIMTLWFGVGLGVVLLQVQECVGPGDPWNGLRVHGAGPWRRSPGEGVLPRPGEEGAEGQAGTSCGRLPPPPSLAAPCSPLAPVPRGDDS